MLDLTEPGFSYSLPCSSSVRILSEKIRYALDQYTVSGNEYDNSRYLACCINTDYASIQH